MTKKKKKKKNVFIYLDIILITLLVVGLSFIIYNHNKSDKNNNQSNTSSNNEVDPNPNPDPKPNPEPDPNDEKLKELGYINKELDFFKMENLDRYLSYKESHPDLDNETIAPDDTLPYTGENTIDEETVNKKNSNNPTTGDNIMLTAGIFMIAFIVWKKLRRNRCSKLYKRYHRK